MDKRREHLIAQENLHLALEGGIFLIIICMQLRHAMCYTFTRALDGSR